MENFAIFSGYKIPFIVENPLKKKKHSESSETFLIQHILRLKKHLLFRNSWSKKKYYRMVFSEYVELFIFQAFIEMKRVAVLGFLSMCCIFSEDEETFIVKRFVLWKKPSFFYVWMHHQTWETVCLFHLILWRFYFYEVCIEMIVRKEIKTDWIKEEYASLE